MVNNLKLFVKEALEIILVMAKERIGGGLVTLSIGEIVFIFMVVLTIRGDLIIFDFVGVVALTVTSKFIVVFFFEIVVVGEICIFIILLPVGFVVNIVGVTADGDVVLINVDTFVACLLIVVAVSLIELRDILDELRIACTNVVIVSVMVSECVGNGGETLGIVNVVVFVIVFIFMVVLTIRGDLVIFDFVGVVALTVTSKFIVVFFFEIVVVGEIFIFIILLPVGFVVNIVGVTADGDVVLINVDTFVACLLIVVAVSLIELRDILDELPIACTKVVTVVVMVSECVGNGGETLGIVNVVVFVIVFIFMVVLTIRGDLVIFDFVGVVALTVTSKFIVVFFFEIVVVGEICIFIILLPVGFVVNIVGVTADGDVVLINVDTFVACLLIVVAVSLIELRDILDELRIACINVVIVSVMVSECVGNGGETLGIVNVVVFVIVFIFMVVLTIRGDLVIFDFVGVVALTVTSKFIVVFFFKIVVVGEIFIFIVLLPVGFVVNIVGVTADGDVVLINVDTFVACLLIVVAVSLIELRDILDELPIACTKVVTVVVMVSECVGNGGETLGIVNVVVFVIVFIFMVVLTIRGDLVIFDFVGVVALTVTSKFIVVFFFEIVVVGEICIFIILLPVGFVVNIVGVTADGDVVLINVDTFVACLLIVVAVSLIELRDILDELRIACINVVIVSVMVSECVGNGGETLGIVNVVVFVIVFIFMVVLTIRGDLVIFDFVGVVALTVTSKFIVVFFFKIVVVGEIFIFIVLLPVGFVVNIVGVTADGDVVLINVDTFVACLLIVVAVSLIELRDILDELPIACTKVVTVVVMVSECVGNGVETFGIVNVVVFAIAFIFMVVLTVRDDLVIFDFVGVVAFAVTFKFTVAFFIEIVVVGDIVVLTIILPVGKTELLEIDDVVAVIEIKDTDLLFRELVLLVGDTPLPEDAKPLLVRTIKRHNSKSMLRMR